MGMTRALGGDVLVRAGARDVSLKLLVALSSAIGCGAEDPAICPSGEEAESGAAAQDSGVRPVDDTGVAWPNNSNPGLDYSSSITLCPVWSGIRDEPELLLAGRTYRAASGGSWRYGVDHEAWRSQGVDATSGDVTVDMAGAVTLTGFEEGDNLAVLQGQRKYRCDGDGLWLESDRWALQTLGSLSDRPPSNMSLAGYVDCSTTALRLLPRDITVGDTWEGTCAGDAERAPGSYHPYACTFTFVATEASMLPTPAGMFDAIHVVAASNDPGCADDDYFFFAASAGFWVGRGMGLLQSTDALGDHLLVWPSTSR